MKIVEEVEDSKGEEKTMSKEESSKKREGKRKNKNSK